MKSEDSDAGASTPTITEESWHAKDSDSLLKSRTSTEEDDEGNSNLLQRKISVKVHLVIFSFYILTSLGMGILLGANWTAAKRALLYSPANDAVEYYVGEFTDGNDPHGMYVGEPRPSLEKAWQDLLGPMNVRLSLEDVRAFDREATAVKMSDDSGYIATDSLAKRWLHKYVYQDEYWPGLDDVQREKNRFHSSLVIYSWQKDRLKPGANGTGHTCANWGKIAAWTKERTVDMYKPGLIIHPQLGPAYPDGQNDKEHISGALHEHGAG
ncbi:hypothetical protein NLG97_g3726 [Lecanicillium saksenae]|uniref:Uncharacterized protein n=1 Tax=Lecanicillium saksenae TaxID=468837 RepID=A0ACC1R189_9HYPO|nr:hypothetical protein NLG97_g3726 [Lecanicillium saksenae]